MSFGDDLRLASEWVDAYLARVRELPVLARVEPGEIRARLPDRAPDGRSRSRRCCATSTTCSCPG